MPDIKTALCLGSRNSPVQDMVTVRLYRCSKHILNSSYESYPHLWCVLCIYFHVLGLHPLCVSVIITITTHTHTHTLHSTEDKQRWTPIQLHTQIPADQQTTDCTEPETGREGWTHCIDVSEALPCGSQCYYCTTPHELVKSTAQ
jgi:hypothetical protein